MAKGFVSPGKYVCRVLSVCKACAGLSQRLLFFFHMLNKEPDKDKDHDKKFLIWSDVVLSMILQSIMIFALGALIAVLFAIAVAPLIWARASNVTRQQLMADLPMNEFEIRASRDHLRAEHAIRAHRLESKLEQAEQAKARQLIEINRRELQLHELNNQIVELRHELTEKSSQNVILMQNIDRKVPHLEDRSNRLMSVLIEREKELAALKRHGIYTGVLDQNDDQEQENYYQSLDEIEQMRQELDEEMEADPDNVPRRTLLENAESVHEENRDLLSRVAKLQARLIELEGREAKETALLRSEMQNIASALMQDHDELYRSHFHNLSSVSNASDEPKNQLPFEFEFSEKKPVFIEKAEIEAQKSINPTSSQDTDDETVTREETSLTARLETLLKQK